MCKENDLGNRDCCWYCGGKLIWQNDYDLQDLYGEDQKGIVTYLTCSNCGAEVEYILRDEEDTENNIEENSTKPNS